MKQVGDEKKKVLEQLECGFADMVAQRNGYELKLQTLKDKIENPSQGKRSSILLQKKGVDKENLDINNIDSDPDFITPLKKNKEEELSSTGKNKRATSTRCSTRRRTARSASKNVSYNEITPPEDMETDTKPKSSRKTSTRKSRKALEEVSLESDNVSVADSEDSNLQDEEVFQ